MSFLGARGGNNVETTWSSTINPQVSSKPQQETGIFISPTTLASVVGMLLDHRNKEIPALSRGNQESIQAVSVQQKLGPKSNERFELKASSSASPAIRGASIHTAIYIALRTGSDPIGLPPSHNPLGVQDAINYLRAELSSGEFGIESLGNKDIFFRPPSQTHIVDSSGELISTLENQPYIRLVGRPDILTTGKNGVCTIFEIKTGSLISQYKPREIYRRYPALGPYNNRTQILSSSLVSQIFAYSLIHMSSSHGNFPNFRVIHIPTGMSCRDNFHVYHVEPPDRIEILNYLRVVTLTALLQSVATIYSRNERRLYLQIQQNGNKEPLLVPFAKRTDRHNEHKGYIDETMSVEDAIVTLFISLAAQRFQAMS